MPVYFNRHVFTISIWVLLALSGIACRKKVDPVLPGIILLPVPAAPVEPMEQPPQSSPAPVDPPPTLPQPPAGPPPEESKKPVRRVSRPTTPAAAASSSTNQPLHLGEMLTPEQERQYNTALDRSLQSAQANIAVVLKRRLSQEQQGVVAQVQSFIEQAQSGRRCWHAIWRAL